MVAKTAYSISILYFLNADYKDYNDNSTIMFLISYFKTLNYNIGTFYINYSAWVNSEVYSWCNDRRIVFVQEIHTRHFNGVVKIAR